MPAAGLHLFALDLGQRAGFAAGPPGLMPRSGVVALKKKHEHRSIAFSNLIAWLSRKWTETRPDLVVIEAPFHLGGFAARGNSQNTVMMAYGMIAIVEGLCIRFGVQFHLVAAATVRKHFIGASSAGDRKATKDATVARAQLLKMMAATNYDDNQADACAIWHWADSTFFGRVPAVLHLFGEKA